VDTAAQPELATQGTYGDWEGAPQIREAIASAEKEAEKDRISKAIHEAVDYIISKLQAIQSSSLVELTYSTERTPSRPTGSRPNRQHSHHSRRMARYWIPAELLGVWHMLDEPRTTDF